MKPLKLLFIFAMAVSTLSHAQTLDITGVALGSPFDEAVRKLGADGFKVTNIRFPWPDMTGVFAFRTKPYGEGFTIQAIRGKTVYVQHIANFSDGAGPNVEETVSVLKQKFGQRPTAYDDNVGGNKNRYLMEWDYDGLAHARPQTGPQSIVCNVETATAAGGGVPIGGLVLVGNVYPSNKCVKRARADVIPINSNPQIASSLLGNIVDVEAFRTFYIEKNNAKQSEQNRDGAAAKKVKPPV